ncbi:hypothetical protein BCR36DRAFT_134005 [Piromyces finnis]|uniref:EGF-like domain-containing protein n=1 Tax=Piromyces finnis TaxID=1754191 RepID=A0A1Y1VKS9_9FUNG|nr:hypothetical protein BCR36DRAFT_134005 [Piromyces finnis]|eukprot:ORX57716.1 hypothetical protein BCR36DRAFT_134005 [Piromyces finnis]
MNGGAIYISYQEIFNNSKINILNNTFFNNHSKYFGGALYLDKIYDIFLNDSIFENNLAEISGSSLYSPNEAISKSNLYYINHKNNTTNMNESIYSTFPSNIILDNFDSFNYLNESKFHIGDYINLKFSLRDKYGNKIIEFLKYNNISLKVVVISNDKIKIKGNVCTFTQNTGICQLQYFQIFSESKVKLTLKFEIENNIYNIKSIDNLNITIYDCEENQIKILDGKHYKCEYPVCESWCMNNNKTKCVPSSTIINVNKLELNVCECRPGYIGYHCEDLLFENFNNIKIAINIITSLIIFIMIISLILILIKRNQPILSDTGWIKQLIILIGLIQYFSSKYFIINENWTQSYLSFLFKHSGIFLTYLIFWIYVSSAQDFGVGNRDYELKIAIKKSRSRSLFTPSYIMEGEKLISDDKSKELSFIRSELKTQKIYEKVRKNHFLYIKCLFYFPIIIFILISCVIYQNKARKIKGDSFYYVQGQNEKWYYESPLKSNDIVFNIIEFIISIILALKLKKISKYECIFKTIKYIYIVVIIIITIGPLIDVIGFYVLKNIIYQVLFNYITNLICYTSVYGFFFGKLILYLLLKKEKCCNIEAYFVYPTKSFCYEHWSYLCECEKSLTPLEINFKMKRFIEVYIQCSKIIEIYDGNIKLLNSSFGLNLNQDF